MTGPNKFTIDVVANDGAAAPIGKVEAAVARLTSSLNTAAAAYERLQKAQQSATSGGGKGSTNNVAATRDLNRQVNQLENSHRRNASATASSARETNNATSATNQLNAATERTVTSQNTARYALYQTAAAYGQVSQAALKSVQDVVSTAVAYEAAFAQVARTTDLGSESRGEVIGKDADVAASKLEILNQGLIEMSRNIPVAFDKLTAIASLGAQLGIASSDVEDFTEVVAQFSATTNVTTEATATYFGRLQNILDVPTSKFRNLASAVSELGTDSVATESEILAVTTQIGAMANNAGFSAEYVVGLGTALASLRVPPELARGTTTRVFQLLSRAVADNGEDLKDWARVLGVSSDEAKKLWETNPEEFFTMFVNSLGRANDQGQSLIPILDSLGIKAARDVPVITRLANSYELLGDYVGKSFSSFSAGTYLDTSFKTIAETTQASLTEMSNSFNAFKASAGESLLPIVNALAKGLNWLFEVFSKIPAPISGAVLGLTAMVGALLAVRAATALVAGVSLALRAAQGSLQPTSLRLGNLFQILRNQTAGVSVANQAATATTVELTVAQNGAAAGAARLAATTATIVPAATAATGAMARLSAAGAALNKFLGPAGWLLLAGGALIGLWSGLKSSADAAAVATQKAAEEQQKLNQSWYDAGEGADALKAAINADTQAYKAAGNQATEANGVFRTWTTTIKDLGDGMQRSDIVIRDATGAIIDTIEGTERATDRTRDLSAAVSEVTGVQDPMIAKQQEVKKAVDETTVAIGAQTAEWEKAAINEKINSAFNTPEMQTELLNLLGQFDPETIEAAFATIPSQGSGGIAKALDLDGLNAKLQLTQEKMAEIANAMPEADIADIMGDVDYATLEKQYDSYVAQIAAVEKVIGLANEAKNSIDAIGVGNVFQQAISEYLDMSDASIEAANSAEDLAVALTSASDALKTLTDDMFAASNLEGDLAQSFSDLGASIAENGSSFDTFSEAGRANLSALEGAVQAYSAIQQAAVGRNEISAKTAASNVGLFIQDLIAELGSQDIDTTNLDSLANYAMALTSPTYTMSFDADTSAAIAGLTDLAVYSTYVRDFVAGMTGGASNMDGASANPGPMDRNYGVPKSSVVMPTAPSQVRADKSSDPWGAFAAAKAAGEAENLQKRYDEAADAADEAGKAAEEAGKAAADAAEEAAEKVKLQEQYVKDLAASYKTLTSDAFSAVTAEGKVFESLTRLGESLQENGNQFNTMTAGGRANFDALASTMDAFGETLSQQIADGTLTAEQAAQKYREFASGVYGELVRMGVPTEALTGYFQALGVSADGWANGSADVKQYAGFIDSAEEAMAEFAKTTQDEAVKAAIDYAAALDKVYESQFGVRSAADDTTMKIHELRDAYRESIDKVKELRAENRGLSSDLAVKQADKRKAEIERNISKKYGETDRAADYGAQAKKAGTDIADIKTRINTNKKEVAQIERGRNALRGNSKEAINNRRSLRELQQQMINQISTYAKTGASTEELARYTEQMRAKFQDAAKQAGYTKTEVAGYTAVFDDYVRAIKNAPTEVLTKIRVEGRAAAVNELAKLPKGKPYTLTPAVKGLSGAARTALRNLPNGKNYVVKPKVDQQAREAVKRSLSGIGSGQTVNVKPKLTGNAFDTIKEFFTGSELQLKVVKGGGGGGVPMRATTFMGGLIGPSHGVPRYNRGGLVPGNPPSNPYMDNMLVDAPGGKAGLRSGEYVVREPAVKHWGVDFLDMVNNRSKGYYAGGAVASAGGGGGGSAGTMVAELSPVDRKILFDILRKDTTLYSDKVRIASTTNRGNGALTNRGVG